VNNYRRRAFSTEKLAKNPGKKRNIMVFGRKKIGTDPKNCMKPTMIELEWPMLLGERGSEIGSSNHLHHDQRFLSANDHPKNEMCQVYTGCGQKNQPNLW
jgi:hypothetical protein